MTKPTTSFNRPFRPAALVLGHLVGSQGGHAIYTVDERGGHEGFDMHSLAGIAERCLEILQNTPQRPELCLSDEAQNFLKHQYKLACQGALFLNRHERVDLPDIFKPTPQPRPQEYFADTAKETYDNFMHRTEGIRPRPGPDLNT